MSLVQGDDGKDGSEGLFHVFVSFHWLLGVELLALFEMLMQDLPHLLESQCITCSSLPTSHSAGGGLGGRSAEDQRAGAAGRQGGSGRESASWKAWDRYIAWFFSEVRRQVGVVDEPPSGAVVPCCTKFHLKHKVYE